MDTLSKFITQVKNTKRISTRKKNAIYSTIANT